MPGRGDHRGRGVAAARDGGGGGRDHRIAGRRRWIGVVQQHADIAAVHRMVAQEIAVLRQGGQAIGIDGAIGILVRGVEARDRHVAERPELDIGFCRDDILNAPAVLLVGAAAADLGQSGFRISRARRRRRRRLSEQHAGAEVCGNREVACVGGGVLEIAGIGGGAGVVAQGQPGCRLVGELHGDDVGVVAVAIGVEAGKGLARNTNFADRLGNQLTRALRHHQPIIGNGVGMLVQIAQRKLGIGAQAQRQGRRDAPARAVHHIAVHHAGIGHHQVQTHGSRV